MADLHGLARAYVHRMLGEAGTGHKVLVLDQATVREKRGRRWATTKLALALLLRAECGYGGCLFRQASPPTHLCTN